MYLSKTTEYALRILGYMALDEGKLYSANEIYKDLKIPFRYLRKQLTILSKSGLLESVQGKAGGYRLPKKPEEIRLIDIVRAMGDNPAGGNCFFGLENCAFINKCAMHDKWAAVREKIYEVLSSTTLEEIKKKGPDNFVVKNK